jgi:hypothetical protein
MDLRRYGVSLPGETTAATAEHASLALVDASATLVGCGVPLPRHFDGRRKWRRLLSRPLSVVVTPGDECARALADRVAIASRGALLLDLVAPHDETEPYTSGARPPSLVALHRNQYVWGARENQKTHETARRVKTIVYYRPAPTPTDPHLYANPDDATKEGIAQRHYHGASAYLDRASDALCAEIYLYGPVTTAVDLYEDLAWPEAYPSSWIGGIYRQYGQGNGARPGRLGAIVVSLVGWSLDAASGRRYYLARGGPAARLSPEDGIFCLWAGQCGVEEHAVAALPDLWGSRLPARFLHDAAPADSAPGEAQRARDLRGAMPLHPSGHTRTFVASLPPEERRALTPLVDPVHLPATDRPFIAGRVRNPHEAPGAHDPP